jgi:dethiobiotin synthetase
MNIKAKTIFVTGTDTDAGKTYVSCGILEAANNLGLSSAAIKPIAAGGVKAGEKINSNYQNDDALALQQHCSLPLSYEAINPVCFESAIAPHVAAESEGKKITVAQLLKASQIVLSEEANITVIEGAGGWRVPINEREYVSDLVKALNVPVILVVAMRLGCINHALLSAQAIRQDGLQLVGWIANQIEADMCAYAENVKALVQRMPAPMLAEIHHVKNFSSVASCAKQIDVNKILNSIG